MYSYSQKNGLFAHEYFQGGQCLARSRGASNSYKIESERRALQINRKTSRHTFPVDYSDLKESAPNVHGSFIDEGFWIVLATDCLIWRWNSLAEKNPEALSLFRRGNVQTICADLRWLASPRCNALTGRPCRGAPRDLLVMWERARQVTRLLVFADSARERSCPTHVRD